MEIGILGLSSNGKTTLFNALTGNTAPTIPTGRVEPNIAVVNVPDPRVDQLSALYNSKKVVYATIRYIDIPGQAVESSGKGLSDAVLGQLATTDMLLAVLRGFSSDATEPADIANEAETLDLDLTISDLSKVENRLPRLEQSIKKVTGKERERLTLEKQALERIHKPLEEGQPIRALDLSPEEERVLRGFSFMTQKPILYLINCSEPEEANNPATWAALGDRATAPHSACGALACQIEEEIAQLPPEDREEFLADYGIEEPGAQRMIRLCYDLLGVISFLTAGPKETHAWTIPKGSLAPQAAGAIHTDFERGFIRAEVIAYKDLVQHGSTKACRDQGLLRTEGKNYEVKDGDVIEFLFNV